MSLPLAGVTVVDLSRILAGPYCTMVLGDLGAEVLKIESPLGDDSRRWGPPFASGESAYFLAVNRNKRSICLDLKREAGSELLHRLLEKADVLVENFRPGTMERLGFGFEQLQKRLPELIYCSISGYGHTGPLGKRPGYDVVMQGEGGWMQLTGEPGGQPFKVGVSLADIFSGTMAAQGILSALYSRTVSGHGQKVDVALFDSVLATLCFQAQGFLLTGEAPGRLGNRHPSLAPYESFPTADGYVIVGVGNDGLWQRFCKAVDREDLDQPRFKTNPDRVRNYSALKSLLDSLFTSASSDHWVEKLESAGIPVGRVRSIPEVFENPQIDARHMRIEVDHPVVGRFPMTGNPIKMEGVNEQEPMPPPLLGQHTEEVLRERLNLSRQQIEALRGEGVFGT